MANTDHVDIFKSGSEKWNAWRLREPRITPDLSDLNFETDVHTYRHLYDTPTFIGFNLANSNLNRISARNSFFENCKFSGSDINFSDLCYSAFHNCEFDAACMRVTKLSSSQFHTCDFTEADLSYSSAEEAGFTSSRFEKSILNNMRLVSVDFTNSEIHGARVFGVSVWNLNLDRVKQSNIYIEEYESTITVPSIELAQFISLLVTNPKIRDVIDTITSKVVLILGRFTVPRKKVLDEIKAELSNRGYVPILFDFEAPQSRNLTETIKTLAGLSKFIIADLTDPRSIPQELSLIVPHFASVPVQPIIEESQDEWGMYEFFQHYPWVLKIYKYKEGDIKNVIEVISSRCEEHLMNEGQPKVTK